MLGDSCIFLAYYCAPSRIHVRTPSIWFCVIRVWKDRRWGIRVVALKSITRIKTLRSGFFATTKPGTLKTTSKYEVSATPPARESALWQPALLQVRLKTGRMFRSKLTFDEGITISAGSVIVRPHDHTHSIDAKKAAARIRERVCLVQCIILQIYEFLRFYPQKFCER